MAIFIGGMPLDEYVAKEKMNPESTNVFWEFVNTSIVINGELVGESYGKCTFRGVEYEGKIEKINGELYVGGRFVKKL